MTGDQATALRNTAFAVMFLCHGRAPLMFNKLAHGPDWDRKLRDLSGLTRYAGAPSSMPSRSRSSASIASAAGSCSASRAAQGRPFARGSRT